MAVPRTEMLVYVDGRDVARKSLDPGKHTLGRSQTCCIQIEAALVSDRHAQLTVNEDNSLLLEDLGSAAGTFLDGKPVTSPTPVTLNQTIQIGSAQILILESASQISGVSTVMMDGGGDPAPFLQTSRYELGPEIAKGGMGAVLTARQPAIRREVAVKVMLRTASGSDRLRFIEEAQITGQLEHPNIVPVHELALTETGQPYYTMKLVKGSTLREILSLIGKGNAAAIAKYPLATLLTIFQKVCDAVAFAHAKGVIHRDLKPENMMVGEYGEVLVMDWGLAKSVGQSDSTGQTTAPLIATARHDQDEVFATMEGALLGTPQYMSPEQARGEVATLDQRSDIFCLGTILYELVTLSLPFPGKSARDVLAKIQSGSFDLPNARLRSAAGVRAKHLPGGIVPDSLEAVITKALALDPGLRYQDVVAFQADLTAYQGGFATAAENAGAWKLFRLFVVRHRALSTAVAASLLLIAGITAAFTSRVVAERNRTVIQRDSAVTARAKLAEANAENLRNLQVASISEYAAADQRMERDNLWDEGVAQLARALDLDPENQIAAKRLYTTIIALVPDRTNLPRFVLDHEQSVAEVSFSPDGARILTASGRLAQLWDAQTGQAIGEPIRDGGDLESASFRFNGSRIVTIREDGTTRIWDAATCKPIGKSMRQGEIARTVKLSSDGTRMLTMTDPEIAEVWDVTTDRRLGEPIHDRMRDASFSADGTRLVNSSDGYSVMLWDATSGKQFGERIFDEKGARSPSFSPDGTRFVTITNDSRAKVWDVTTGKPLGEPMRHLSGVSRAIFSPDGTRIATASADSTARIWDADTGNAVGEAMKHNEGVTDVSFSPDGRQILTVSGDRVQIWEVATGRPVGDAIRRSDGIRDASFSPDGARILTVGMDRTAEVWDVATGMTVGEPIRFKDLVRAASFSPDGDRIVSRRYVAADHYWDVAAGRMIAELASDKERASFFGQSLDGQLILSRSGKLVPGEKKPAFQGLNFGGSQLVFPVSTDERDDTVQVWKVATGKPIGSGIQTGSYVLGGAFSADNTRLALWFDKSLQLWDVNTSTQIGGPMRHDQRVMRASFSPDGKYILTESEDKTLARHEMRFGKRQLWESATGKALGQPMERIYDAKFNANGTRLVTANLDGIAQVWDVANGLPVGEPMNQEARLLSVCFSPDGTYILTAGHNATARLWKASTGHPVGELMRHGNTIHSGEFSSDGAHIITASAQIVRIWETTSRTETGAQIRYENAVSSASFSPDGARFVSADKGVARLVGVRSILRLERTTPEWVRDWARAIAGMKYDKEGVLQPMPVRDRIQFLYARHDGDDSWSKLARWVATVPSLRTVDPDALRTCREIAERERDFGIKESLESALRYDPTVPLARTLLGKFEDSPRRAAFLRDYDAKRESKDAVRGK